MGWQQDFRTDHTALTGVVAVLAVILAVQLFSSTVGGTPRRIVPHLVDNDGEWGELRFDFENGTAEIVKLADWDTVKSNVFAKAAIQYMRYLLRQASAKQVIVLYVK